MDYGVEDSGHYEPNLVDGLETSGGDHVQGDQDHSAQTFSILRSMIENVLHFTLVFVVAATAPRCSEVLALRWADIIWEERKIRIVKSWKETGVDGDTKTEASERNAPNGAGVNALPVGVAQPNAIRQTQRLRFPVSSKQGQGSDLRLRILPRSFATSG
jgi:integrase